MNSGPRLMPRTDAALSYAETHGRQIAFRPSMACRSCQSASASQQEWRLFWTQGAGEVSLETPGSSQIGVDGASQTLFETQRNAESLIPTRHDQIASLSR